MVALCGILDLHPPGISTAPSPDNPKHLQTLPDAPWGHSRPGWEPRIKCEVFAIGVKDGLPPWLLQGPWLGSVPQLVLSLHPAPTFSSPVPAHRQHSMNRSRAAVSWFRTLQPTTEST